MASLSLQMSYIHLTEEAGEIARELFNRHARKDLYNEENIKEEICDLILEAMVLASHYNIDLEKALNEKLDKLYKRHGFS